MLGRPARGAVMLAAFADVLGLAEGVETALSAMILLGFPVWAALGSERFGRMTIPTSVNRLILLPDNDRSGREAEAAARQAHARPGRTIETIWPWHGLNDWNDVLRKEARYPSRSPGSAPTASSHASPEPGTSAHIFAGTSTAPGR